MDVRKELDGIAFGMAKGILCLLSIIIGVATAQDFMLMKNYRNLEDIILLKIR